MLLFENDYDGTWVNMLYFRNKVIFISSEVCMMLLRAQYKQLVVSLEGAKNCIFSLVLKECDIFFVFLEAMRKWLLWAYWTSPLMYVYNAISANEFLSESWAKHVRFPFSIQNLKT